MEHLSKAIVEAIVCGKANKTIADEFNLMEAAVKLHAQHHEKKTKRQNQNRGCMESSRRRHQNTWPKTLLSLTRFTILQGTAHRRALSGAHSSAIPGMPSRPWRQEQIISQSGFQGAPIAI